MKKWLSVLVVFLLLIFLVLPGGMGMIAEKRIKKLVSNWPTTSPLTVQVVDYKRGWFTSTMKFAVALKTAMQGQPLNIEINEVVAHGPFIIDWSNRFIGLGQAYATGELTVPIEQQAFFKQYVEQTDLLRNSIFLKLLGNIDVGFDIPELNITDPSNPGMRMTLDGLSTKATVSSSVSRIDSHSTVQSITWQTTDETIALENLAGKSSLKKTSQGLWLGDIKLSLKSLLVSAAKKTLFALSSAEYTSFSKESDGLVSGKNDFGLDKLTINGVTYGPAKLGINISNVNAAPLAQLKRLSQAMQAQNNVAVFPQGDIRKQKLIFKIIARGMQLTVTPLSVQTPNGEVTGQLSVTMPNLLDGADGKSVKHPHVTISELLSGLKADVQLSVPKVIAQNSLQNSILRNMQALSHALASDPANSQALLSAAKQRADAQLQGWVAAGLLLINGDNYEFAANFAQGKFMINGKSVFNPALGAATMVAAPVAAAAMAQAPAMPVPDQAASAPSQAIAAPAIPAADQVAPAPASTDGSLAPAAAVTAPVPASTPVAAGAPDASTQSASAPSAESSSSAAAPASVQLPGAEPVPAAQ